MGGHPHLTLPLLRNGPLPLPPMGGEGLQVPVAIPRSCVLLLQMPLEKGDDVGP